MGFSDWSIQKKIKIVNVCLSLMIITVAVLQLFLVVQGFVEAIIPVYLG